MAAVFDQHSAHQVIYKTSPQKVCIGLGIVFIVVGLLGAVAPGLLGLHLSLAHNFIHLVSGILALWMGYAENPQKAFGLCTTFGFIYILLGLVCFLIGRPGYPGVGSMYADQNLFRIVPNVLEFGTVDHLVHLFLGLIFASASYNWKKENKAYERKQAAYHSTDTHRSSMDNITDINRRTTLGTSDLDKKF